MRFHDVGFLPMRHRFCSTFAKNVYKDQGFGTSQSFNTVIVCEVKACCAKNVCSNKLPFMRRSYFIELIALSST